MGGCDILTVREQTEKIELDTLSNFACTAVQYNNRSNTRGCSYHLSA